MDYLRYTQRHMNNQELAEDVAQEISLFKLKYPSGNKEFSLGLAYKAAIHNSKVYLDELPLEENKEADTEDPIQWGGDHLVIKTGGVVNWYRTKTINRYAIYSETGEYLCSMSMYELADLMDISHKTDHQIRDTIDTFMQNSRCFYIVDGKFIRVSKVDAADLLGVSRRSIYRKPELMARIVPLQVTIKRIA